MLLRLHSLLATFYIFLCSSDYIFVLIGRLLLRVA
nr:MAG TPA: hypothetical protein [Caudoviricetes sp.]